MSWLRYSSAAPFGLLAEKHPPLDKERESGGERGKGKGGRVGKKEGSEEEKRRWR